MTGRQSDDRGRSSLFRVSLPDLNSFFESRAAEIVPTVGDCRIEEIGGYDAEYEDRGRQSGATFVASAPGYGTFGAAYPMATNIETYTAIPYQTMPYAAMTKMNP